MQGQSSQDKYSIQLLNKDYIQGKHLNFIRGISVHTRCLWASYHSIFSYYCIILWIIVCLFFFRPLCCLSSLIYSFWLPVTVFSLKCPTQQEFRLVQIAFEIYFSYIMYYWLCLFLLNSTDPQWIFYVITGQNLLIFKKTRKWLLP